MTARRTATRRGGAATGLLGLGAAACAACCAGPILGLLGAIGIASAAGYTFAGSVALVIGAAVAATAVLRRRARARRCSPPPSTVVTLAAPEVRTTPPSGGRPGIGPERPSRLGARHSPRGGIWWSTPSSTAGRQAARERQPETA